MPDEMFYVLREFKGYYEKSLETTFPNGLREDKLRVSSFPYCGLRHLVKRCIQETEPIGFGAEFYMGTGTVLHSAAQRSMGANMRIYGMWKCKTPYCNGGRVMSVINKCPKCKAEMEYVEIPIRLPEHFKYLAMGLIDGLYKSKDGRYFIVDYKTTNVRIVNTQYKTKILPYRANVAQIKAYCALIEKAYNIEISGWILHYVSRDDPLRTSVSTGELITSVEKAKIFKKIKRWDRHYGIVMYASDFETEVQTLIDEKPCKCETFYKENYEGYDPCPLAKVCFNEDSLRKKVWNIWKNRPENYLTWNRPKFLIEQDSKKLLEILGSRNIRVVKTPRLSEKKL